MSDNAIRESRYRDFARDSYSRISSAISQRLSVLSNKQDLLVVVGEQHFDPPANHCFYHENHPDDKKPALASAFVEIAAIEAAVRAVGPQNVKVSLELDKTRYEEIKAVLKEGGVRIASPIVHAMLYAERNGLEMHVTDTAVSKYNAEQYASGKAVFDNSRDAEMTRNVNNLAWSADQVTKVVVHIGGSNHISAFQGVSRESIHKQEGIAYRKAHEDSPVNGFGDALLLHTNSLTPLEREFFYGRMKKITGSDLPRLEQDFVNAALPVTGGKCSWARTVWGALNRDQQRINDIDIVSQTRYLENPANGIMLFDPPGEMPASQMDFGAIIKDAANKYHGSSPTSSTIKPMGKPIAGNVGGFGGAGSGGGMGGKAGGMP